MRWVTDAADLADADVVVIPGSKATVADLAWLRERGLAGAIAAHAAAGRTGARHLRRLPDAVPHIDDPVESGAGTSSRGWGCSTPTSSSRPTRRCGARHVAAERLRDPPRPGGPQRRGRLARVSACRRGAVFGTHWHGLLDNNDVRRDWLDAAAAAGRRRVRRRHRRRRARPPRRPTRCDGRPAGRAPRHRRAPRSARHRPATAPDRDHRAQSVAWAHEPGWFRGRVRAAGARLPDRVQRHGRRHRRPGRVPPWSGCC